MSRHTFTHAEEHFAGQGQAGALNQSLRGIGVSLVHRLRLLAPDAGDPNGLVTVTGSGVTPLGDIPIDGAFDDGNGVGVLDVARNISAESDTTDTTQTITITGTDIAGNLLVEDLALNGTTEVVTASCFKTVTELNIDLITVGDIIMGTSVTAANIEFGLDARILSALDLITVIQDDNGTVTLDVSGGVVTVADVTDPPTASTGDARGTYSPIVIPNGTDVDYQVSYIPDFTADGYGINFAG